ncbi:unnamed protein product, partial [Colletotrichum noveboracense]
EALQAAGSGVPTVRSWAVQEGNKPLAGLGDRILAMAIVDITVDQNISIRCIERNISQQGILTTVEAVLGATFKDGGMEAAHQVMQHLRLI